MIDSDTQGGFGGTGAYRRIMLMVWTGCYPPLAPARHLRPRELRGFHGLHGFSLTINVSNKPGNLLPLQSQVPRIEQMGFGHSSGTAEKQGPLAIQVPLSLLRSVPE